MKYLTGLLLALTLMIALTSLGAQNPLPIQGHIDRANQLFGSEGAGVAIDYLEQFLSEASNEAADSLLLLAEAYHKLGVFQYTSGRLQAAGQNTRRAISIREDQPKATAVNKARSYFLLAAIQRTLRQLGPAGDALEKAIGVLEAIPPREKTLRDSARLGNYYEEAIRLHKLLGDYGTALIYWRATQDLFLPLYGAASAKMGNLYLLKGTILDDQLQYDSAVVHYLQALSVYQSISETPHTNELANAYHNLGYSKLLSGDYPSSAGYFSQALAINEALFAQSAQPYYQQEMARIFTNLILLEGRLGRLDNAEAYFRRSIPAAEAAFGTRFHPVIADAYLRRGVLAREAGRYDEALDYSQEAIRRLVPGFRGEGADENPGLFRTAIGNEIKLTEAIAEKMKSFEQKARSGSATARAEMEAALASFQTLDSLLTLVRLDYNSTTSKYLLLERSTDIYETGIRTALALYETSGEEAYLERAYQISAKNKALVLLEDRRDQAAKSYAGLPGDLLARERNLRKAFFDLQDQWYANPVTGPIQDSLFRTKRDYITLIDRMEQDYPKYYQLKYNFSEGKTVAELRAQLAPGALLIEYFEGAQRLYAFALDGQQLRYYTLARPDNFQERCRRFRSQVQLDDRSPAYLQLGYELYTLLLQDILSDFEEPTELVLIPDGILLTLSFDALLTEPTEAWQAANNPYLIRQYPLGYSYSNQLLFPGGQEDRARSFFGGFGLEYDNFTLEALEAAFPQELLAANAARGQRSLGKLVYSDDEVAAIADLTGGDEWLNAQATRPNFLAHAGAYRILHLAMHGVLSEDNPLRSALVFSKPDTETDFLLKLSDLYTLDLSADLAVLSACNTGYGPLYKGEAVKSLASAFSYAGCNSIVSSLWEAPDRSTRDLLVSFYTYLMDGEPKARALQRAKLDYLTSAPPTYGGPAYWGHLVVMGEGGEIRKNNSNLLLFLFVGAFIILCLFIWASKNKRLGY